MPGVLLDREMPRRNRVAPVIGLHLTAGVKEARGAFSTAVWNARGKP